MKDAYDTYKPTKKQVIIPIIILVIALAIGGGLLGVAKSLGNGGTKTSFLAPGTERINIDEPGNYTIYLTTKITSDQMSYSLSEDFKGLGVELTLDGEQVVLTKIEDAYTYGEENNQSKSYLSFEAHKPGTYQLTMVVEDDSIARLALAIGKTEKNLEMVLALATCGGMLILMGICQFVAYMVLHLGKWLYYYYQTKRI